MGHLTLDVRTKLLLILYSSITVFVFYSYWLETFLILLLGVLQFILKKSIVSLKIITIYIIFVLLQIFLLPKLSGTLLMMISFFVVSFRRLFPCVLAGILLINTTTVSELTSGLSKLKVPRQIIIPLTVTLRYIPAVKEEFGYIKDAMRLRKFKIRKENLFVDILQHIECYYVPLLVSASQISEELSTSAVTRGIENPCKKTFLHPCSFGKVDVIIFAILVIVFVFIVRQEYLGGVLF